MNYYLVKIIFQITTGNGTHTPQFDEQTRLIQAHSKQHAISKAIIIGKQNEDCFLNIKNEPVTWQFINITDIICLADFEDGQELFSFTREVLSAGNYICYINSKAKTLEEPMHCNFDKVIFN